jgi:hypothetical protein
MWEKTMSCVRKNSTTPGLLLVVVVLFSSFAQAAVKSSPVYPADSSHHLPSVSEKDPISREDLTLSRQGAQTRQLALFIDLVAPEDRAVTPQSKLSAARAYHSFKKNFPQAHAIVIQSKKTNRCQYRNFSSFYCSAWHERIVGNDSSWSEQDYFYAT